PESALCAARLQVQQNALRITGARVGGNVVPLDPNIAPPGYYLLFLVNGAGVPSVGEYIRVSEAPLALCHDVTVETEPGVCTAHASIDAGSFDPKGEAITLTQSPPGPYDLGDTPGVELTVEDPNGARDMCTATVTVADREAPVFAEVPEPIEAEQTSLDGTPVSVPLPTATDNCGEVDVISDAPEVFPLGETTVTFTATDGSGNSAEAMTTVTIVDTTPPDIQSVSATPDSLWAPDHMMEPVEIAVEVTDICDANPLCRVVSVASDEPVSGPPAGVTAPDWEITGDFSVNLRAERLGTGDGRTYTITVECTDLSGNSATSPVDVQVVHNQ
ncbi:MAG: HYR domain-containing protein, partial [Gammaproteobacteria bacterium]